jgi:hypothetical protein
MTFATEHFKGAELLEKQGGKLRLALPPQPGMSLGAIFGLIEENRRNLGIGDYALVRVQSTFINLVLSTLVSIVYGVVIHSVYSMHVVPCNSGSTIR